MTRSHTRMPALDAVRLSPTGALYQELGQVFLGLGQILRIQWAQQLICFNAAVELFHQLVIWIVAFDCFVDLSHRIGFFHYLNLGLCHRRRGIQRTMDDCTARLTARLDFMYLWSFLTFATAMTGLL